MFFTYLLVWYGFTLMFLFSDNHRFPEINAKKVCFLTVGGGICQGKTLEKCLPVHYYFLWNCSKKEKMKGKIYDIWHYAGLKKSEFDQIRGLFFAPNRTALNVGSVSCFIITLMYSIISFYDYTIEGNRATYIVTCAVSLVIAILTMTNLTKRSVKFTNILVFVFTVSIYWLSIYTGTKGMPNMLAVTFMIAIIVLPILFNGMPAFLLGQMLIATAIFIPMALKYKVRGIGIVDVTNALSFCFISLVVNSYVSRTKANGFYAGLTSQKQKVDLQHAVDSAEDANRELQAGYKIFRSLGEIYTSMYYVDLVGGNFTELTSVDQIKREIGHSGPAQSGLDFFCSHMVDPQYRPDMIRFTDLETIRERMKDTNLITAEFRILNEYSYKADQNDDWRLACFIDAGRDKDGNLTHVIFATRSINETKVHEIQTMEQLRVSNHAKTDFLFNMSHDIRTPMNAIMGFTKLAQDHINDTETLKEYLSKIESSSEFLVSILNNTLDMAAIESGRDTLDECPCETSRFGKELMDIFEDLLRQKGISFCFSNTLVEKTVLLDPTKLRKIMLNIMSNASKYTPEGGKVSMTINEIPCDRPGYATYQTIIEDTGIGMTESFQKHLFEPFVRAANTTESKVSGTGLGLSIAKRYVDLMGGTIEVESTLGKGSKFTVTISHKIVESTKTRDSQNGCPDGLPDDFSGRRVLIAEDNDLNAEIVTELLESLGFAVERACDGVQCVKKMEDCSVGYYDLVLMDIQMPNMNGYTATQIIRRLPDSEKAGIPIIAMTANTFDEDKRKALAVGMNGHLAKPLELPKIIRAICEVLN